MVVTKFGDFFYSTCTNEFLVQGRAMMFNGFQFNSMIWVERGLGECTLVIQ